MTPTQPGRWQWRWVATTPQGSAATAWRCFEVDPPAAGRHGFLRRSPLDGRYLRFDDGTPYVAIGENLGWYDVRGTFAYDDWFAKLAAQGVQRRAVVDAELGVRHRVDHARAGLARSRARRPATTPSDWIAPGSSIG